MKTSVAKPMLWMMALIMVISIACGTTAEPTATPEPPAPAAPTNTLAPPPTDTPPPPPTPTDTQVPPTEAPPATVEVPPPPPPVESSLPSNCVESSAYGYISCYDDTGSIVMDVPDYWTDINGGEWEYDGEIIGVAISAAPNLNDFNNYYEAEGVFYGASDTFARIGGYIEFLDWYTSIYTDSCDLDGRFDYNDGVYRGKYDQYHNCGGRGGYDAYVLSAVDIEDQFSMIIVLMIQTTPGDTDTVLQIWNTFLVLDL